MSQRHGSLVRGSRFGRTILVIVRRARIVGTVAAALLASSCYSYTSQPINAGLLQENAEFRISDVGRVALVDQLGPGAQTVEGRVVREDASGWALQVSRLTTIRGESYTWLGERIELPRTSVEGVARKTFDRPRTIVAMAMITGAVVAFVLSRNLFGWGSDAESGPPSIPPVSIRY